MKLLGRSWLFGNSDHRQISRWWRLLAIAWVSIGVVSCADYDLTLRFDHSNHGQVVQTLHLASPLTNLNSAQPWIQALEQATQAQHGRIIPRSPQDLELRIPVGNGQELTAAVNALMAAIAAPDASLRSPETDADLAPWQIPAMVQLQQQNRIIAVRNHLSYDIDLTTLSVTTAGRPLFTTGDLVNVGVNLELPWPTAAAAWEASNPRPVLIGDRALRWQPQPGQNNHLAGDFWVPSPVGIGAVIIPLLVGLGWGVRSRWPRSALKSAQKPAQSPISSPPSPR